METLRGVPICVIYRLLGKNGVVLGSAFRQKVHLLRTHYTIQYIEYSRLVYSPYIQPRRYIYLALYTLAIVLPTDCMCYI